MQKCFRFSATAAAVVGALGLTACGGSNSTTVSLNSAPALSGTNTVVETTVSVANMESDLQKGLASTYTGNDFSDATYTITATSSTTDILDAAAKKLNFDALAVGVHTGAIAETATKTVGSTTYTATRNTNLSFYKNNYSVVLGRNIGANSQYTNGTDTTPIAETVFAVDTLKGRAFDPASASELKELSEAYAAAQAAVSALDTSAADYAAKKTEADAAVTAVKAALDNAVTAFNIWARNSEYDEIEHGAKRSYRQNPRQPNLCLYGQRL